MRLTSRRAIYTRRSSVLFFATAVLLASPFYLSPAYASDDVVISDDGSLELSITANRRIQQTLKTLAPVNVITREQIESLQAQDVVDVLRLQSGIDISRNGGSGSQTTMFLRGVDADHVLVLVDGMRVASETIGSFDWSVLPLEQIERIEIVRGARTALYGSDAIGGVIQIFTRKGKGVDSAFGSLSYGKYNSKRGTLGITKSLAKTDISLNVAIDESDGFSATNAKAGEFTFDPDKDGYQKKSINGAISHQLTRQIKVGLNALSSSNNADFDQGTSETDLQSLHGFIDIKSKDNWSQKITLGEVRNELLSTSSFGVSVFVSKRTQLNWQNNLKLNTNNTLLIGLNYREDQGETAEFDDNISNKAVYSALNSQFGDLSLEVAGRYDKHSQAGGKATGQLAVGYQLNLSNTLYASYGSAFKAPNINDLYYPGFFGSFAGNPDLEPETSKTLELGYKASLARNHKLEANLFRTRVENMISYTGENNQAINSQEVSIKGLELSYSGSTSKLNWDLSATLQNTKDESTGERLLRRPDSKVSARLAYAINNKTRFGIDAVVASSRDDMNFAAFPAERVKLGAYQLLNLSAQHKLTKHSSVGLRIENLTDENYETAHGFNTPGRGAYLTLRYDR